MADLHDKEFGRGNQRLLNAIIKEKPEAVFIAGDMIIAKPDKNHIGTISFLNALAKEFPIYYGSGNHEIGRASCRERVSPPV